MRFAIVGEGRTDFIVLRNLLIGFFKDKNLPVARLLPKDREPVGWGNVLNYLSTEDFRNGVDYNDHTIVQIDTNECAEWMKGLAHIGSEAAQITHFVEQIKSALIEKVGLDYYGANAGKIHFAVCVHEMECWLLPFNAATPAHHAKMVNCANTLEKIANTKGFSINQKNYEEGKHYDDLSKEMKNNRALLQKASLNPSLGIFVESLTPLLPSTEGE